MTRGAARGQTLLHHDAVIDHTQNFRIQRTKMACLTHIRRIPPFEKGDDCKRCDSLATENTSQIAGLAVRFLLPMLDRLAYGPVPFVKRSVRYLL